MEVRIAWTAIVAIVVLACCLATERSLAAKYEEANNCKPPSIRTQSFRKRYFLSNSTVKLVCTAKGDGKLSYEWLKDGEPYDSSNQGTLTIAQASAANAGTYQCRVSNHKCGTSLSSPTELLFAELRTFPQVEKPTVIKAVLGQNAKLKCQTPYSVPKASTDWILIDSVGESGDNAYDEDDPDAGVGYQTVKKDRRVTLDYHGNLYITSLRKEDEQDGKTYVCQAKNRITRSTAQGEDKVIQTKGTITNMGVELMWHSDTDTMVLQGKKAKFKCIFSGQPEPEIKWTRLKGGAWDDSRMIVDYHELIIKDVQYGDVGDYVCSGRNSHSWQYLNHTFHLEVKASPQWRVTPRNVEAGVQDDASFECDAVGNPEPTVEWFINGAPYSGKNSNGVLSGKTLKFKNLRTEDSQVIQCNASNIYGYIWADIYLFVQALPPVIQAKPKENLIVAQDAKVTLTCEVTGKPKPRVVWTKGRQDLNFERYITQDSGSLVINGSVLKDTGTYNCKAENQFGVAEASGFLTVRRKTKIIEPPVNQKVDYNNKVEFTCGATTDPNETLTLRWLKDKVPVDMSDPRISISANQGTLTISDTKSKDTGTYTCVAENALDNSTADAKLEVKAPPDPPYDVSIDRCLGKGAELMWKFDESMRNFNPMIGFILESRNNHESGTWSQMKNLDYPTLKATVVLKPHTSYWFRVRAVNKMGVGPPSKPTFRNCTTPMAVPDVNPENVRTDEALTGYLVVKWKPMKPIDLYGYKFAYVLKIVDLSSSETTSETINDYRVGEFKRKVNTIYSEYIITVKSRNVAGECRRDPKEVLGYSGEGIPTVTVNDFEVDPDINVTANMAGFRWSQVNTSKEVIKGEFQGYKIRFWKKGEKDNTMHQEIIPDSAARKKRDANDDDDEGFVRAKVMNLPSFSQVVADVVVINKNHMSYGSNKVTLTTPEGVPGPVEYLEAMGRGINHINLAWNPPPHPNGRLTGYRISYRRIDRLNFGTITIVNETLTPDDLGFTITGLEAESQYRIFIKASTSKGWGKDYFIDVVTASIKSDLASPKIQNVLALDNEANVSWSLDISDVGARIGRTYYLEHRKKGDNKWETSNDPIENRQWANLDHLQPGTTYHVRVVAMDAMDGKRKHSEEHMFRTSGVGAARGSFLSAAWFIGMMIAIAILILILIIVCIVKRNRGDNYPVQEKERLRGNCDDNHDQFNGFGKGSDENGIGVSSSFDRDGEKVPLDADGDSMDYGDDDAGPFNEDGSFIGQYGRGDKSNDMANVSASSNV